MVIEKNLIVRPVPLYDQDVQDLAGVLDRYQRFLYGKQHCNLEPLADLQKKHAFMLGAYTENKFIGIGAVKIADGYGEIKRLIVEKKFRGSGATAAIIPGLEVYTMQQNRKVGLEPTGKNFIIDVMDIARIQDGQIIEHWGIPDRFALLLQLGFITPNSN